MMESETSMAHHHHDDETYFLDQICMVALSGAFGVICLCLYFVRQEMLFRLLATQFHPFVLGSGIALLGIALLRAGRLWSLAAARSQPRENTHTCETDHTHEHADCGHVHSHSHSDHDAGWAPWRYVVLFVPIILFLLGLPNKGPSIDIHSIREMDTTQIVQEESCYLASLAGISANIFSAMGLISARHANDVIADDAEKVSVKQLIDMGARAADREFYRDKMVRIRGQYAPRSNRYFDLVRFRVQCCPGDAIQISVPVFAKDNVAFGEKNIWVEVIGRVEFQKARGSFDTVVVVSNRNHVRPCGPELNPYLP
jgi:hypothetical protein